MKDFSDLVVIFRRFRYDDGTLAQATALAAVICPLDTLHLAAAFAGELTLVSADKPLIRCAAQCGVKHRLIA
jgi:hypothetical protein